MLPLKGYVCTGKKDASISACAEASYATLLVLHGAKMNIFQMSVENRAGTNLAQQLYV